MIKQAVYGYAGMNQDISKDKRKPEYYFEANNIRIIATSEDSTGSITTEKGNTKVIELSSGQVIIGGTSINNYIITISTDNAGNDTITRIDTSDDYSEFILFEGNLNLSTSNYAECVPSYENDSLQKVFWVDGINQLRFINIIDPVSSKYPELLDVVPSFNISQPKLESTSDGGSHTSGRIQYTYNLAIKNGQQSTVSPFSQLISLTNNDGSGGNVDDKVNQTNNIIIENVDTKFDIIRLYAIKYTSYNQSPTISLIAEENIVESTFRFSDDGSIIYNTSLEELLFLGGTPVIPKTIDSKKNRLLLGNITEKYFDLNQDLVLTDDLYFDTRAYRFPLNPTVNKGIIKNSQETVYQELKISAGVVKFVGDAHTIADSKIPIEHDCINTIWDGSSVEEYTKGGLISNVTASNLGENFYELEVDDSIIGDTDANYFVTIDINSTTADIYNKSKIVQISYNESLNFKETIINILNSKFFWSVNPGLRLTAFTNSTSDNLNFSVYQPLVAHSDIELTASIQLHHAVAGITTNDISLYKYDTSIYGATGTDLTIEVVQKALNDPSWVLKDNEIYRFGLEFYNTYGQASQPRWITDLKMPQGNLTGIYNTIKVTIDDNGKRKLDRQGIVGYRLLRVERTDADKTILDQGIISSSVVQIYDTEEIKSQLNTSDDNSITPHTISIGANTNAILNSAVKLPTPLLRTKSDIDNYTINSLGLIGQGGAPVATSKVNGLSHNLILNQNNVYMDSGDYNGSKYDAERIQPYGEVFSTNEGKKASKRTGNLNKSLTIQNNKLLQLYSPEAVINQRDIKNADSISIVGTLKFNSNGNKSWGRKFDTATQQLEEDLTNYNGLNLYKLNSSNGFSLEVNTFLQDILDSLSDLIGETTDDTDPIETFFHSNGMFGPTGDSVSYIEYQYGRDFIINQVLENTYSFKDGITYTGRGERNIKYDPLKYNYYNDIKTLLFEKNERDSKKLLDRLNEDDYCQILSSINSIGNNCYLFAEEDETALEDLISATGDTSGEAIIGELRRVLYNQYGGNSYEARSRNSYLRIGDYTPIAQQELNIDNAGDTFVGVFRFARILPNLSKIYSPKYSSICEIVEIPVESSIDLSARNDESSKGWNSIFHPQYEEYHTYNRVYSQEPIATKTTANLYTFDDITVFSNKINTTKVKTSGEIVDSWTDILINEELLLDGKYGSLNKIIVSDQHVYAFQDKAIALLQVQPRIQQVTNDGYGVELGTGTVLYNHEYISTESGSVNQRSIFKSPSGVYYLDLINKTVNKITSDGILGLSTQHGLHSYFNNNLNYDTSAFVDTIHGIFDPITDDAYFTIKDDFTIAYNEKSQSFTSFYGFNQASIYLKDKTSLLSCNTSNKLYEHGTNDYCVFYDAVPEDSDITLLCAPNMFAETLYYTLEFSNELRDSTGNDVFKDGTTYTLPLKSLRVWNDYQDSGLKTLTYKSNMFRRFRNWGIQLPKDSTFKYDFIRGKWAKIKLDISNDDNNTLVLHNMLLNYNEQMPIR